MSTIVTRAGKGSPLTNNEVDSNFTNLNTDKVESITSADGSVVVSSSGTTRDLSVGIAGSTATLISQVRNETGATLTKGTLVYISGASGNKATVSKARANTDATSAQTYGMVQADIPNNQNGYVVVIGVVSGVNTSAFADGTQLYLSGTTAGEYTSTKPSAPTHLVYVGVVTRSHATQGTIEVKIQNGYEMDELHDVAISSPATGQILVYNASTGLWSNSSVLSSYLTTATAASTYLPLSGGTLTGNLGIGTSSTGTNRLVIRGDATTNFAVAKWSHSSNASSGFDIGYASSVASNDVSIWNYENGFIRFATNGTERARIDSTGNLGIGTSSPSGKLTVANTYTNTSDATIVASSSIPGINLRTASTGRFSIFSSYNANNSTSFLVGTGTNNPSTVAMYLDHSTGYLGVGTTGPVTQLQVNSGSSFVGGFKSTVANGYIALQDSGTSGALTDGNVAIGAISNDLAFRSGGATRMRLDSSGNLGLGVTPSAWFTNRRAIQIGDTNVPVFASVVDGFDLMNNSYTGAGAADFYTSTGYAAKMRMGSTSGQFQWFTAPSGTAATAVTFTQAMTLTNGGNLGLGTTAPSGASGLTFAINGGAAQTRIALKNSTTGDATGDGFQIVLDSGGTDIGFEQRENASIRFITNNVEALRILNNQNVGIGTSSPAYKLHTAITVAATSTVQDVAYFSADSSGSTTSGFGARLLLGSENPNGNVWPAGIAALNDTAGSNLSSLGFYTATSGPTLNERARIASNGNFGIGTSSPAAGLHVSNTFGNQVRLQETSGTYFDIASGGRFDLKNAAGTTIVSIAQSGNPVGTQLNLNTLGDLGLGYVPNTWYSTFAAIQIGASGSSIFGRSENNSIAIGSNVYVDAAGSNTYIATNTASYYQQLNGTHAWYYAASGTAGTGITFTQVMSLSTAGALNTLGAITQNGSQVLHAGNYNSYAPTLTGTGASGTWGISITGNAATVTNGLVSTGSYANPSWITSLDASKLTGTLDNARVNGGTYSINISGTAATATALQTARTINGVSFNGTANITVADSTKLSLTGGSLSGPLGVGDTTTASITDQTNYSNPLVIQRSSNAGKGAVVLRGSDSIGTAIEFGRSDSASHWGTYLEFLVHDNNTSQAITGLSRKLRIDATTVTSLVNLQLGGNTLQLDQSGTRSWNMFATGGSLRTTSGDGAGFLDVTMGGGIRSPLYYDYNNTGYYLDPNGTSQILALGISSGQKLTLSDANHYLRYQTNGFSGVTIDGPQLGGHQGGELATNMGGDNWSLRWNSNGDTFSRTSSRAPIFYDSNDTAYYVNPNGGTVLSGTGIVIGSRLSMFDDGNVHIHASSGPMWLNATDNSTIYLNGQTAGFTQMNNSARSPIFYDSGDTGYYVDPNSTTQLNRLQINNGIGAAADGVANDPYGFVTVTRSSAANYAYYGLTRSGQFTASLGIDTSNNFWIGGTTSGYNATRTSVWFYMNGSGDTWSNSSSRAPIFYDSNDTGRYVDPNGTTNIGALNTNGLTLLGGQIYISPQNANTLNSGYAGGTDIWINYRGQADGFTQARTFRVGDGRGTELMTVDGGGGWVGATNSLRAPIFYDSANTGYFLNPNGGDSNLGGLTLAANVSTGRSSYGSGTANLVLLSESTYGRATIDFRSGVNYPSDGAQIYYETATDLASGETSRLVIRCENDAADSILIRAGQIVYNSTTVDGGSQSTGHIFQYGNADRMYIYSDNVTAVGSSRAPIFYDSSDTAYYTDPTATSRMASITVGNGALANIQMTDDESPNGQKYIHANGNNIGFLSGGGSWIFRVDNNSICVTDGSFRAPIFYDSNNTGYFVDPASASNFSTIYINGTSANAFGNYWAGTAGYPGYQFAGGNGRFGFSSTSGVLDVYADGNFYATDSSHLVLHAGNYNSYSPTLTGGSASGTWGISVTGSARSISLPSGQTEYTILDGPGNGPVIKVRYDGATANRYIDIGSKDGNGVYYTGLKIYNGDTPTWGGNTILHAGNYSSYALPLSGGTISGNQTITGTLTVSSGNSTGGGIVLADDGDIVDLNDSYCSMRFSGGVRIFSANRGGSAVILLGNGGSIVASNNVTAYGSPSDRRLKENIQPLTGALNKVMQLQGCTFDWKEESEEYKMVGLREDIGFIADAVQNVVPSMVRKGTDGYLSLRDRGFSALLVEAMKEQHQEVIDLRNRVAHLESLINKLIGD